VLDEATANIDLENEAGIRAAVDALTRRRTVIVIAYRLWSIVNADEIWVLERGQFVQRGTHDQLLAEVGACYQRPWKAQAKSRRWRIAASSTKPNESDS